MIFENFLFFDCKLLHVAIRIPQTAFDITLCKGKRIATSLRLARLWYPAETALDKASLFLADHCTCLPPRLPCRWQRSGAQPAMT